MQEDIIHPAVYHTIYGIKSSSHLIHPQARENLFKGISFSKAHSAELLIRGCSEITLAITESVINRVRTVDTTNILARALIHKSNPHKLNSL